MSPQTCPQCHEVMLGSVNRCWQCGHELFSAAPVAIPPVRRAPVRLAGDPPPEAAQHASHKNPLVWLPKPLRQPWSNAACHLCARASICCGLVACVLAVFSWWALPLITLGIILAIKAYESPPNQDLATTGLVLNVLALFVLVLKTVHTIWLNQAAARLLDELNTPDDF